MSKYTPPKSLIRPLAGPINGQKPKDHLHHVRLDTKLQAARYLDEAVRVLVDTMRDTENPKLRKEAALDLIQMVLGKPSKPPDEPKDKPQVLDVEDSVLEAILEADETSEKLE